MQNERTALAWQRTALAMIAGAAIVARLTLDRLGALVLIGLVVSLPLGLWVLAESRSRYRDDPLGRARDGRATAAVALGVIAVAVTELAALLVE